MGIFAIIHPVFDADTNGGVSFAIKKLCMHLLIGDDVAIIPESIEQQAEASFFYYMQ